MQGNNSLLTEVNERKLWHAYRKTKPLWAKLLTQAETIKTLEGELSYKAGDYLCRGESGDVWGQKAETLFAKYEPVDNANTADWMEFRPKPASSTVLAAQIEHEFTVDHPSWGLMQGKAGDYLVKNLADIETDFPADIWIVDQSIFKSTYERVLSSEEIKPSSVW